MNDKKNRLGQFCFKEYALLICIALLMLTLFILFYKNTVTTEKQRNDLQIQLYKRVLSINDDIAQIKKYCQIILFIKLF